MKRVVVNRGREMPLSNVAVNRTVVDCGKQTVPS